MTAGLAGYIAKNKLRPRPEWQKNVAPREDSANPFKIVHTKIGGERTPHPMIRQRFPLVLMLEPLHACNLTCTGCGRIREYETSISKIVPLEKCFAAVDECGAPIVSICGGEPFLYPQIGELVSGILGRKKNIYLCTNGMFIRKKLHLFQPNERFYFNVHLDGMEKNHDIAVEREGVFREAIEGIKAAKAAGFKIATNTTIYAETDMAEVEELFAYLKTLGVDAHAISPAYGYSAVNDREIFLTRDMVLEKCKDIDKLAAKYPIMNSPLYLDFLQGKRDYPCTAWGNPTYNIQGWKGPCYLITDKHHETFEQFMTETAWESYGHGNDPRCEHCMMHCGYEPSAAFGINSQAGDTMKLLSWMMR
ncbi:MAG: adenosyl-hopene transferase HpnH [Bryobacteraceae bacterium]|nr:adenosyl-hopene transferase HpnH [Bryobacteraceae bacterium]